MFYVTALYVIAVAAGLGAMGFVAAAEWRTATPTPEKCRIAEPPPQPPPEYPKIDEMDTAVLPIGKWHAAPDHAMDLLEAQLTMHHHRCCRIEDCQRKEAAWLTLVLDGRISPATPRRNYSHAAAAFG